ncbi:LysR substrate-binding domain-containing protein [Oceaniglobus trochenteri]|uniref:LysR substrate-binding domain-containing protein n=1 Tax=Oceaniglobus trochenteri TaxID=2763260 RepID=UPI001CFFEBAD|nr:LysR substrate-binding domain-containing protein [Oceaniglobus trochenteri]
MARTRKHAHILRHLVVFATACRTENFTRAAEELGVSRVAVSRQIAELEAHLETRLFERAHRQVHPTRAGADLEAVVGPALAAITEALERLREPEPVGRLNVTVTAAFANFWLMPRLAAFSTLHPSTEINMIVSDRYLDLADDDIDIAIRYGPNAPPGGVPLIQEMIFPVWSPSYEAQTPLQDPEDLLSERLLQLGGHYRPQARWEHWFAQSGLHFPGASPGTLFDSYITMLQAAVEGQGIALAGNPLIDAYLSDGRLVRMETARPLPRDVYWLVTRSTDRPEAVAFATWIADLFREGQPGQ